MKILVTGASGFAAEHLIPVLRAEGHYVIGTDRQAAPSSEVDEFLQLDLCDINSSEISIQKVETVIHLAAARADWGVSDAEFHRDNVKATVALMKFCNINRITNFIFASSISVMPQNKIEVIDEQSPNAPINSYGYSKEKAEHTLIENAKITPGFSLNIIRPAVLYGPSNPQNTGMYRATDNNIFRLIDSIYKKRFAFIGDTTTKKTTAYVKNFVDSIMFLLYPKPGYQIFIYCDEPPLQTGDLVRIVRRYFGRSGLGPKLPYQLSLRLSKILDFVGAKLEINFPITHARILTFNRPTNFRRTALNRSGFKQKIPTDEALRVTILWYLDLIRDENVGTFFVKKDK